MNKDEFIKKAHEIFNKSNSMEESAWVTIIVGNGSNIFTDEYIAGKYLYLLMGDILIARVKYEDIKEIKLTEESDLEGVKK
jgi:hypothetical protein